jgi:hypothetical protein
MKEFHNKGFVAGENWLYRAPGTDGNNLRSEVQSLMLRGTLQFPSMYHKI